MQTKYEKILAEQGAEAARDYMRALRGKVKKKTVPFGGRGYFGMLKDQGRTDELNKVIKKATEARSAKNKNRSRRQSIQPVDTES